MANTSKNSSITSQYLDSGQVFLNLSLTDNSTVCSQGHGGRSLKQTSPAFRAFKALSSNQFNFERGQQQSSQLSQPSEQSGDPLNPLLQSQLLTLTHFPLPEQFFTASQVTRSWKKKKKNTTNKRTKILGLSPKNGTLSVLCTYRYIFILIYFCH